MSLPIFTPNIQDNQQVDDVKSYLLDVGAEGIDTEKTPTEWYPSLQKLIPHLKACFTDKADAGIDCMLNNVTCLMLILPDAKLRAEVVREFCDVLCSINETAKNASVRLSVLNNLFHGLPENCKERYPVHLAILKCASETTIYRVVTDPKKLNAWITQWGCTNLERRHLWKAIQAAFNKASDAKRAQSALVEVLSTYTEEDAGDGRADAIKAIISTLMDEDAYTMDHLISLKPVQYLEGELIHDLLTIFVNGNLTQFMAFTKENPQFSTIHGLDESACISKMRLLTLMGLGEAQSELDYNLVQENLHLDSPDELEEFIIDAVSSRAIMCKLDQEQQRILILNTRVRSVGPEQWTSVQRNINHWQVTLSDVLGNLENLMSPVEE